MIVGYVGLLKIEFPSHTVRLSDGGFITYDGGDYTSQDSVVGTLAGIEPMTEGKTGEIPALDLTFNVPAATAITVFTNGALQQSTVSLWLAKYDVETNIIQGTPDLQFLGQVDQPAVQIGRDQYMLSISAVSKAEWFFESDTGNTLSSAFHKDVYSGETGHDNATGLSVAVAWGTEGPVSQFTQNGGGSGGGFNTLVQRV